MGKEEGPAQPQPLTKEGCKTAGMTWNDQANVLRINSVRGRLWILIHGHTQTPHPYVQLTRIWEDKSC